MDLRIIGRAFIVVFVLASPLSLRATTLHNSNDRQAPPTSFRLPEAKTRRAMIHALAAAMTRLDGAALGVRASRAESWDETVMRLEKDAAAARTPLQFWRVFRRLNSTYPNLHATVKAGAAFASSLPPMIRPSISFSAMNVGVSGLKFVVSQVDSMASSAFSAKVGDEVVAINDKPMKTWLDENFLYCKWPLRSQCNRELLRALGDEVLPWSREEPLFYTLRREERTWRVRIPIVKRTNSEPASVLCGDYPERYPGFTLAYTGMRTCIYESKARQEVAVLRIINFFYDGTSATARFHSPDDEVNALLPFWRSHAGQWHDLIIDVIDNGGGNTTIPYDNILLSSPYQEQYARFRKVKEIEDQALRHSLFWGSEEHELWFQRLREDGTYAAIKRGAFLPPVPMFCPTDHEPCDVGEFHPVAHPFRGRIRILLNRYCVSSCDGFVFTLKQRLGKRVSLFGEPQAADATFSRLSLAVVTTPSAALGFSIVPHPIRTADPAGTIVNQVVAMTQNVAPNGAVLDGAPVPADIEIPYQVGSDWDKAVFQAAMSAIDDD